MQCRKTLGIAALFVCVAIARPVSASVNYTAVNKVIPNGTSFPIDFNHDGSNDFSIASSFGFPYCSRAYSNVAQGSASIAPLHSSSGVILANGYAAALAAGVTV